MTSKKTIYDNGKEKRLEFWQSMIAPELKLLLELPITIMGLPVVPVCFRDVKDKDKFSYDVLVEG